MQYRRGCGDDKLSILGFGGMRFSKSGNKIDIEKAETQVMEAVRLGINYFDTAYVYGGSEAALGEIFEKNHCREQVFLADKLPHYLIRSKEGLERTFQEQLRRLHTEYIDYYMLHMLTDVPTWEKLRKLGIQDWIEEKLASGQIRHIGFSYHGNTDTFCELLDAYSWEFCLIQYNYLDEHSQAGRRGLTLAAEKGLPVMIMEPLRGGRLSNMLPDAAKRKISENQRGYSAAEWGFRWLWNQPEVTCVLSGMNSLEMVRENAQVAAKVQTGAFTEADFALIDALKREINHSRKVGCTGCGYCMPCPKGVDIPGAFSALNTYYSQDKHLAKHSYMQCTIFRHEPASASQCIGCGKCEQHCPQKIAIRKELKQVSADLETVPYRAARGAIRLLHIW